MKNAESDFVNPENKLKNAGICYHSFDFKIFIVIFLFLFITTKIVLCSSFPLKIKDMSGKTVRINSSPQRIICIGPSASEIVFSLVEQNRIIGVSSSSNYPPEVLKKEKVGDIYLNYEKIVNLKPDLVIVESSLYFRDVERLRNFGIKTLAIKSDTFDNFTRSLKIAGAALGEKELASQLQKKLGNNMKFINSRVKNVPIVKRPRVFVEIWNQPLMTAGSGTFIHYVIENAGGINIAADMTGYPQLNTETLLLRNPDVIVLTTSTREQFLSVPHWRNIGAVKNGRVFKINPDILVRPTLRLYDGCRTLYNWFYPDTRISSQ